MAMARPSYIMFPNLRRISFDAEDHPEAITICVPFMHPPILEFEILIPDSVEDVSHYGRSQLRFVLESIPRMCLLQRLSICGAHDILTILPTFPEILKQLMTLRKLILPRYAMQSNIIEALALAPMLEDLCTHADFRMCSTSSKPLRLSLPSGSFPSLRKLTLFTDSRSIEHFLIHHPFIACKLEILKLELDEIDGTSLEQATCAVSRTCEKLRELSISKRIVDDNDLPDHLLPMPLCSLSSTLALPDLTGLHISHLSCPPDIIDEDLDALALHIPAIEILTLDIRPPGTEEVSKITLNALAILARRCEKLQELKIYFNGRKTAALPTNPSPFKSLQCFSPSRSFVSDPYSVAFFLALVLPVGCKLQVEVEPISSWDQIKNLMPLLMRMRTVAIQDVMSGLGSNRKDL
ncbi:hypothetical protein H0H81_009862 [Sphagnurus paluster]|uniref:Uncharacterized protein n=1 Tax=Sphagnurus paluster TaxID=117069 RepID=A0A9P7FRU9_9AGAR|nr:hypothetical protein H0H81_009862 [Sphagnurus paluster]